VLIRADHAALLELIELGAMASETWPGFGLFQRLLTALPAQAILTFAFGTATFGAERGAALGHGADIAEGPPSRESGPCACRLFR